MHLQYLGYPILNDPLYNDVIFGPEKGRAGNFGKTDEQLVKDLIHAHNAENWSKSEDEFPCLPIAVDTNGDAEVTGKLPKPEQLNHSTESVCSMQTQTGIDLPDTKFDQGKFSVDPFCQECKVRYKDPEPKDLIMYLHAVKYSGPDWEYETPMPVWANVNWENPL